MFEIGDKVDIMEHGQWEGPYTVVSTTGGRTKDHIVLNGAHGWFEVYNDFPFNIRHHV